MEFIANHFLGTLVNFICVLFAGVLGALLKRGVPKRFSDIIMSAMAVCVIYIGVDGVLAEAPQVNEGSFLNAGLMKVLVMIISMAVGTIIGELIDLDKQLGRLGELLGSSFKKMLSRKGEGADEGAGARFAEGFVGCSLLFCVGAMAINGPPVFRSRAINTGAPIIAVSTETGISEGLMLRAAVSTKTMNTAPKLTEAGTSTRLSLPNAMRQIWGISSPTHPT